MSISRPTSDPQRGSHGPRDSSTVVLCSSLVVAQGMARALGLDGARVQRSVAEVTAHKTGQPPQLVIFFESDARLLTSAVHLLKRRWPQARALLVGLANQQEAILGSVAAGANGIVLDEESFDELEQAVPAVRAGSFRAPPKLIGPLFYRLVWLEGGSRKAGNDPRLARLTTREREILEHVARGEANKQIAAELHVEEQTIKNQLGRIFRKLNVHTRADAARVWLQSAARRHEPDRGA